MSANVRVLEQVENPPGKEESGNADGRTADNAFTRANQRLLILFFFDLDLKTRLPVSLT